MSEGDREKSENKQCEQSTLPQGTPADTMAVSGSSSPQVSQPETASSKGWSLSGLGTIIRFIAPSALLLVVAVSNGAQTSVKSLIDLWTKSCIVVIDQQKISPTDWDVKLNITGDAPPTAYMLAYSDSGKLSNAELIYPTSSHSKAINYITAFLSKPPSGVITAATDFPDKASSASPDKASNASDERCIRRPDAPAALVCLKIPNFNSADNYLIRISFSDNPGSSPGSDFNLSTYLALFNKEGTKSQCTVEDRDLWNTLLGASGGWRFLVLAIVVVICGILIAVLGRSAASAA
jgi:hypothetical protein